MTQELEQAVRGGDVLQWENEWGEWMTPRDSETMLRILREDPTRHYRLAQGGSTVDGVNTPDGEQR